MVFKLVRTDTDDPRKITLHPGTYFVGRGNLIDCDDKRVSRKHFEIDVDETVTVKALHLNPIFFKKTDTVEIQIIKQNTSINVSHGDKIGLLPKSFWYELLCCDSDSESARKTDNRVTNCLKPEDALSISATEPATNELEDTTDKEQLLSANIHEALTQRVESPMLESQSILERAESPSMLATTESPSMLATTESPSMLATTESPSMLATTESPSFTPPNRNSPAALEREADGFPSSAYIESDSSQDSLGSTIIDCVSPVTEDVNEDLLALSVSSASPEATESKESPQQKRCHSPQDLGEEAKKMKVEPQDSEVSEVKQEADASEVKQEADASEVKQEPDAEPQPGPSGDQGRASTCDQGNASAGAVIPPNVGVNPQPARERCYYGEKCYRRNPVHKLLFAHPTDADWGVGDITACPYGAACVHRDPRHAAVHHHPPGWDPAPPPPPRFRPAKQSGTKKRRRVTTLTEDEEESDEDSLTNLIVAGKRTRKTVKRESWSGSDPDEEEDPFQTDESDDWVPEDHSQFTQDTED